MARRRPPRITAKMAEAGRRHLAPVPDVGTPANVGPQWIAPCCGCEARAVTPTAELPAVEAVRRCGCDCHDAFLWVNKGPGVAS